MTAFFLNLTQDKKSRISYNERYNRHLKLELFIVSKKPKVKGKKKIERTEHLEIRKNFFSFRVNSRCILTAAAKSVYINFSLSRHMFRKMANNGYLPMISQASW